MRERLFAILGLLGALALVMNGCGSEETADVTGTESPVQEGGEAGTEEGGEAGTEEGGEAGTEEGGEAGTEEGGEAGTEEGGEAGTEEGGEAGTEEGGESTEMGFCEQYAEICGAWVAETPCADWWAAAAPGTEGDTEGATQACYWYHLDVAAASEGADVAVHCGHAMGGAPCVDAETEEGGEAAEEGGEVAEEGGEAAEEGGEAAEEGGEAAEEGGEAVTEEGGEAVTEEGGEAVAEEGGEATEEVGACTNDADKAIVESIDVQGVLQGYATSCLDLGSFSLDPSCLLDKLTAETNLSDPCAQCFVDTAICGADNCLTECIDGGDDCLACSEAAGCTTALEECSGLQQ